MALYKLKDSPYWWVTLVNPHTKQRIRRSTKLTDRAKALEFEKQLTACVVLGKAHHALEPKKHQPTWQEASQRWLHETQHKKDHLNDKIRLEWLKPHMDKYLLADLTHSVIQNVAEIKASQTSQATANRYLTVVRSILNRANKQWGWLDKTPYIRLYKERTRRIRYLTKDEARALIAQLPPHLSDMALFSLQTGLRASNVTGLTWRQVNLQIRHMYVYADESKSGKALSIPLNDTAVEILKRLQDNGSDFVFTYMGSSVSSTNTKAFRKGLKRAGIEDFRWHDLRHTWASWHVQAGTPLYVLQELGGWQSVEMVQRYAHLGSEHLAKYASQTEL